MPDRTAADQAALSLAKTTADVLRRELQALVLTPDASLDGDHLGAYEGLLTAAKTLVPASRDTRGKTYAWRDLDRQVKADFENAEHSLFVLKAVHVAHPAPASA